jgi:hypothetical protein
MIAHHNRRIEPPCQLVEEGSIKELRARPLATSSGPYTIIVRIQLGTPFKLIPYSYGLTVWAFFYLPYKNSRL